MKTGVIQRGPRELGVIVVQELLKLDWSGVDVPDEPLLLLELGDELLDPGELLGVVFLFDVDQAPLTLVVVPVEFGSMSHSGLNFILRWRVP